MTLDISADAGGSTSTPMVFRTQRITISCARCFHPDGQRGKKDVLDHVVNEIRTRREAMAGVGVHDIDVRGDKTRGRLPIFPKNRRNQFALVGDGRQWFDVYLRLAGRTCWLTVHKVIVAK